MEHITQNTNNFIHINIFETNYSDCYNLNTLQEDCRWWGCLRQIPRGTDQRERSKRIRKKDEDMRKIRRIAADARGSTMVENQQANGTDVACGKGS